jgi:hypothetical protein
LAASFRLKFRRRAARLVRIFIFIRVASMMKRRMIRFMYWETGPPLQITYRIERRSFPCRFSADHTIRIAHSSRSRLKTRSKESFYGRFSNPTTARGHVVQYAAVFHCLDSDLVRQSIRELCTYQLFIQ